MRQTLARFLTLALLLLAIPVQAAPTALAVQGGLRTALGGPVADGAYAMAVRLYASESDKTALFQDKFLAVAVAGGVFALELGTSDPQTLLDDTVFTTSQAQWVAVQVGGDPELSRVRLRPLPYALHANVADNLTCSGCVAATEVAATFAADLAKAGQLAAVALSGSYNDLKGLPDLTPFALTGKPNTWTQTQTFGANLDLAGHQAVNLRVQSGSAEPMPCSAQTIGLVYFDTAAGTLKVCNGKTYAGASCGCSGACGNGKIDPGEACDDGNTKSGDGCSATCGNEWETVYAQDFSNGAPGWTTCAGCSAGGCPKAAAGVYFASADWSRTCIPVPTFTGKYSKVRYSFKVHAEAPLGAAWLAAGDVNNWNGQVPRVYVDTKGGTISLHDVNNSQVGSVQILPALPWTLTLTVQVDVAAQTVAVSLDGGALQPLGKVSKLTDGPWVWNVASDNSCCGGVLSASWLDNFTMTAVPLAP